MFRPRGLRRLPWCGCASVRAVKNSSHLGLRDHRWFRRLSRLFCVAGFLPLTKEMAVDSRLATCRSLTIVFFVLRKVAALNLTRIQVVRAVTLPLEQPHDRLLQKLKLLFDNLDQLRRLLRSASMVQAL